MDLRSGKTRVLVFEWLVGGGLLVDDQPLESCSSMFRQGALMRRAIAEDFAAAGCEVLTTTDSRWLEKFEPGNSIPIAAGEELPERLKQLSSEADFLFIVAPESGGRLVRVLKWLEPFAERLLSPGRQWAELFSDKQASCDWLVRVGVRVPPGKCWTAGSDSWPPTVTLPVICKPNDGCGGEGIRLVQGKWPAKCDLGGGRWRIESLVEGEPLSVVVLLGAEKHLLLQPTRQLFSGEAFGVYVGGEMIADEELADAVWRTVEPAVAAMRGVRGVIGFDLVVNRETGRREERRGRETCGESEGENWGKRAGETSVDREGEISEAGSAVGAGNWVVTLVEVNPRLTSSYLGLREYYDNNLATCLLQLACREAVEKLRPRNEREGLSWRVE